MTTLEPGASDVFTHGGGRSPRRAALRARSPAAIISVGLEVFVQLVSAAITTAPSVSANEAPSSRRTPIPGPGSASGWVWAPGAPHGQLPVSGSPVQVTPAIAAGGSLAGNELADAPSGVASRTPSGSAPDAAAGSTPR